MKTKTWITILLFGLINFGLYAQDSWDGTESDGDIFRLTGDTNLANHGVSPTGTNPYGEGNTDTGVITDDDQQAADPVFDGGDETF